MRPLALAILAVLATTACNRAAPSAARDSARPAVAVAPAPADTAILIPTDTGVHVDSAGRLVFPMLFAAACQGEDCRTTFVAVACQPAELRAAPEAGARVSARVAAGDSVEVQRTDLHVLRPGIVVVRKPFASLHYRFDDPRNQPPDTIAHFLPGDTLFLLHYLELGTWRWWRRGKAEIGDEFWAGPQGEGLGGAQSRKDSSNAVGYAQPTIENWWLVATRQGRRGWWEADSSAAIRSVDHMQYEGVSCTSKQL